MAELYREVIPFEFTGGVINKVVKDYYSGATALQKFYSYTPGINEIEKIIQCRKKFPFYRKELSDVLESQYGPLKGSGNYDFVSGQIRLLKEENTFTVTAAHQPNLLLGPIYYIYKISSIIKFTQLLKEKYPAYNFVPVFWMGSEDNDTDELAHINLYNKKIEWKIEHHGAFGKRELENIEEFKNELQGVLGNTDVAAGVLKMLEENYFSEKNVSSATRKLLHHLFGQYGLVVMDGNDAGLKRIFAPAIKDELINNASFKQVKETVQELEKAGYGEQAHSREINLFYLEDGMRQRIVQEGDKYKVFGTDLVFTKEEMTGLVDSNPGRFSPNVILRPVYQEMILPDLAFVGGGAELSYWLQLKSAFEYYKVHYPMILLRDIVLLTDEGNIARQQKLGFEMKDMFRSKEELVKTFLDKNSADGADLDGAKEELKKLYDKIEAGVKQTDASLGGSVQAELAKTIKGIEAIEDKVRRAEKRKNETVIQQIEKFKDRFYPSGVLQERYTNFIEYYLTYGEELIPLVMNNINLLEQGVKVLVRKN